MKENVKKRPRIVFPKGIYFKIEKNNYSGVVWDTKSKSPPLDIVIYFFDKNKEYLPGNHIGSIQLDGGDNFKYDSCTGEYSLIKNIKKPTYRTHSTLSEAYHGKGIGILMYAKAIQLALKLGFTVKSSGQSSSKAKRVWSSKGLRRFYRVRKVKPSGINRGKTWQAFKKHF